MAGWRAHRVVTLVGLVLSSQAVDPGMYAHGLVFLISGVLAGFVVIKA